MQDDVENVREKIDIVETIRQYTKLTQTGKNFKGVCPFHAEKTPSFFVRPDKGMYYCFGCQRGGDVYSFVMEKENLSFSEALELLARRAGITLQKTSDPARGQKKERLLRLLADAADYFQANVQKQEGRVAFEYLQSREISSTSIHTFGLGYALDSWDAGCTYFLKKGYAQVEIIDSGLAVPSNRSRIGMYDRFRDRLMFPVWDHMGRVVGFSGRTLKKDEQAKYINTPETILFKKGSLLYGYDKAQEVIQKKGYAILVEGNVDVISLHQNGLTQVVAPLGTGLTVEQLKLLKRICARIMVVFDMDEAGRMASERAAREAASEGFEIKIVQLTQGKDPDEAVRKDPSALRNDLVHAMSAFDYFLTRARYLYPGVSAYDAKKVAEYVFEFVHALSDSVVQNQYLEMLARELSVSLTALLKDFTLWKQSQQATSANSTATSTSLPNFEKPVSRQERIEEYMIALVGNVSDDVLKKKEIHNHLSTAHPDIFTQSDLRILFEHIQDALLKDPDSLTSSIQSVPEDLQERMHKIILYDFGDVLRDDSSAAHELTQTLSHLEESYFRRRIKELTRIKEKLPEGSEEIQHIHEEIRMHTRQLREMKKVQ